MPRTRVATVLLLLGAACGHRALREPPGADAGTAPGSGGFDAYTQPAPHPYDAEPSDAHPSDARADAPADVPPVAAWTREGELQFLELDFSPLFMSGDGRRVVGHQSNTDLEPLSLWIDGGMGASTVRALATDGPGLAWSAHGTTAWATSADGKTTVGSAFHLLDAARPNGTYMLTEAVRWTADGTMEALGFTERGPDGSTAIAVSPNGAFIAGTAHRDPLAEGQPPTLQPFIWSESQGMTGLPDPTGLVSSSSFAVTKAGVVFGRAYDPTNKWHLFSWSMGTGSVELVAGPVAEANLLDFVSDDGAAVAGTAGEKSGTSHGYRWTRAGGHVLFGPDGATTTVLGMSADGAVVVGQSWNRVNRFVGFVWTERDGYVVLKEPPGSVTASASFVSRDGSTIYGNSGNGVRRDVVVWGPDREPRLPLAGAAMLAARFSDQSPGAASDDGKTIAVGTGFDIDAKRFHGLVVRLP